MPKVVVIGGGFAGCAAAAAAARAGAEVTLLEKSDAVGGLAQVGGSFRMGGKFTTHEEMIAMGAGDIPKALDDEVMYKNLELQDQRHVNLYNIRTIAKRVDKVIRELGIKIIYQGRATDVEMDGKRIKKIKLDDDREFEADAFVEATGGCGPMALCKKYGNGCVSCIVGCPTFGGRVSIAARAGVPDMVGLRYDGTPGAFAAAFTLVKESLSADIQKILDKNGELKIPLSREMVELGRERLKLLAPGLPSDHADVLQLTYMGYVNIVGIPYLTREELGKIPGFENAVYFQPSKGWIGNSIRYLAVTPRDNYMKVEGLDNLFVAGEKSGGQPMGVDGAFTTGALAGHNAARKAVDMPLYELPTTTAVGAYISFIGGRQGDLKARHTMTLGIAFNHINELGLYTTDVKKIHDRVKKLGLTGVFSKKLA